ncbi:MAG: hypothetical protein FWD03_02165 [Defluviitaleaceae bacterium]|nr:hypothetical protein [Defluviitaleaceae bacterium]
MPCRRISINGLKPDLDIELISLSQLDIDFPDIKENGKDPLENARIKAMAYYDILKQPVFSADSGLYFDGLPDHLQPGLFVRRVNGKRLTDDEMIVYYSQLAKDYGGKITARYINGICLILGEGQIFEHMGDDIATERFYIGSVPHSKQRVEGFPIDSLSIHIKSGMYYYDMQGDGDEKEDKEDYYFKIGNGFRCFFGAALS